MSWCIVTMEQPYVLPLIRSLPSLILLRISWNFDVYFSINCMTRWNKYLVYSAHVIKKKKKLVPTILVLIERTWSWTSLFMIYEYRQQSGAHNGWQRGPALFSSIFCFLVLVSHLLATLVVSSRLCSSVKVTLDFFIYAFVYWFLGRWFKLKFHHPLLRMNGSYGQ